MASSSTKFKVSNITIGIQAGTVRTLYASWDAPTGTITDKNNKQQNVAKVTKEYEYQWLCYHDDHSFVTDGTTKYRTLEFTPGENVTKVNLKIRPVAEEYDYKVPKTTGSGKNKKTDYDTKKTTYYSGEWAKRKEDFVFEKVKVHTYKVVKETMVFDEIEMRQGRKFITAHWEDNNPMTYYEGFECLFGYYDGAVWNDETTSVPVKKKDGEFVRTYKKEFEIPAIAKKVRFTVKPVPKTEGVFIGANREKITKKVTIDTRTTEVPTITMVAKTDGTFVARWKISDHTNVGSFSVRWQYWVKNGKNGFWSDPSSGTVDYNDMNTGAGFDLLNDDKTSNKKSKYSWISQYDIPSGSNSVRFSVKPEPKVEGAFTGDWQTAQYVIELEDKTVTNVQITRKPRTDWTLVATWGVDNKSDVDKFEYRWLYQIKGSDIYFDGPRGDVPVVGHLGQWNCEFEPPSDVKMAQVKIQPIPKYATAFSPDWGKWTVYTFNIPKIQVYDVVVARVGSTGRNFICDWKTDDLPAATKNAIDHFEIDWAYKIKNVGVDGIQKGLWFYDQTDTTHGTADKYTHSDVYTAPAEAIAVKACVKPVPKLESNFVGVWSEGSEGGNPRSLYRIESKSVSIKNLEATRAKDGRVLFTWEIIEKTWLTDFTIETQYYSEDGLWTGVAENTVNKLNPNYYYDVPAGALKVKARVKPNYEADCGKNGSYSSYCTYGVYKDSKTVTGLTLAVQKGSTRDVVATWDDDDYDAIGTFSIQWRYGIPNPNTSKVGYIWISDSNGTTPVDTPSATYTAPDNAVMVGCKVMPVPEDGKEYVFNGEWCEEEILSLPDDTTPEVPAVPTAEVEGSKVTVYVDTYDDNTSSVEFQVSDTVNIIKNATALVVLNRASIDFPLAKGKTYRARARGVNKGGETSEWSEWTAEIMTGPSVPLNVKCSATSKTSVSVSWTGVVSATSYTVERTQKKKYFDTAPSQISSETLERTSTGTLSLEMLGLETNSEWFFRVKATNAQGDSEWSAIVNTIIGSKPAAPTTWSSTTTGMTSRDVYLYWLHNSEDKSREVAAQLELTVNGTKTTSTIQNESEEEDHVGQYRIAANTYSNGAKIQWRVRTKGITNEWGDWSTERIVDIFAAPVLSMYLTDGNNTHLTGAYLTAFPLRINLSATPLSQHPVVYSISVVANNTYEANTDTGATRIITKGEEIYSTHYYTTAASPRFSLSADALDLDDGQRYTVFAKVSMDSGLTAEASSSFSVDWGEIDYLLNARMTYSSEAVTMSIAPYCTSLSGAAASDITISIYRRDFDGGFTEIASGLPSTGYRSAIDPHPSMDVARYRVVGKSKSTGQIIFYDLPGYEIGEPGIILQWNERWSDFDTLNASEDGWDANPPWEGSLLKLPYNVDTTSNADPDSAMVNYIGRKHPVSYYGTQVGETFSWKTDVPKEDKNTIYALRRLAVYMGDVYVRESGGVGCWAHVKVSFNVTHRDVIVPVSLEITRVEGGA